MIARTWSGTTDAANAESYVRFLDTVMLAKMRSLDGFCGMQVTRRTAAGAVVFTVTTMWDSMAAIEQFAGSKPEVAVVPPAAQQLLSSYDPAVQHAEVVLASP